MVSLRALSGCCFMLSLVSALSSLFRPVLSSSAHLYRPLVPNSAPFNLPVAPAPCIRRTINRSYRLAPPIYFSTESVRTRSQLSSSLSVWQFLSIFFPPTT
ncbi:hypothetical protein C8Q76DRAFT_127008 [Earliella scabrosa]|nr:hypothetical protein C8Q76DRAFT_127008 [Earliella scabrosa]